MSNTYPVQGMHCPACVKKLTAALSLIPGVRSAHVSLDPPRARIDSDAGVSMEALAAAARSAGPYSIGPPEPTGATAPPAGTTPAPADTHAEPRPSLYPLILIVGYILGGTVLITAVRDDGGWHAFMPTFMAGFFLVFSFFKLLDIRGFADAYQSYDLIARRSRPYAFVYPFIELAIGAAYLLRWNPTVTNAVTLAVMLIGSVGVLLALLGKRQIRCACLGTALNLPMTTVTLIEDLGMAAMAAASLIWGG